ncbi:MAG: hypothetical protein LBR97_01165 [Dysgonamonadaceae bacterium]|jgi:hypothetical protein|nr:hypothetical protein [Dysgonamonadaceae bacterium]
MKTIYKLILIAVYIPVWIACAEGGDTYSNGDSVGRGGSMARFTIHDNYLYTVDNSTLKIFDVSNPAQPEYLQRKDQALNFGIETIFNKDTLLFIGSQDGMYIYSVVRPEFPEKLSRVSHIRSCDPVVASGNYAYVTLNSQNTGCGGWSNVLNIYDISDLQNPELKVTEEMNYPKGLGIDGNKLFVCDAILGIKVYDVSNPVEPQWIDDLARIPEADEVVSPYDVIPVNGLLLTSTGEGLYQFDYTGENLRFVSKITTLKKQDDE